MVNNEFHFYGIALSGFEKMERNGFISYSVRVEVEKKAASSLGKYFVIEVIAYDVNHAIDFTKDIKGKLVCCNGYITTFASNKGAIVPILIAQNVIVLNNITSENVKPEETKPATDTVKVAIVDDDLPF